MIQLPNDEKKDKETDVRRKEEIVTDYLVTKKGIQKDKIAYWFDGRRENMENITDRDNKVEFMLFKYAAGTGWDCPRAHVLVMYREIKSNTFHTQTLGRILRMPVFDKDLSCHPMLRTGYLYTNYQRNEVQNPEDKKLENKPKTQISGIDKKQKIKMATNHAIQQVLKKVGETLQGDPQVKEKTKNFVTNVVPKLAEASKQANETSERVKDITQKNAKINEQKINIQEEVKEVSKQILGEANTKSLYQDLTNLIGDMIDTVVDNRRDAEFVLDPCLLTDFISRVDYGDFGKASTFQSHFKKSMNKYFGIEANKIYSLDQQKEIFEKKGVKTEPTLEREVIVNARFLSDTDESKNDLGKNIKYEVSDNDVEKEFSWRCYEILGNQSDDERIYGNVARTWGTLKESLRQWFKSALSSFTQIVYYKIFLNDVHKGDTSVFRAAIKQALIDYKPILDKFKKKREESKEKNKSMPFVLKTRYAFPDDYKPYNPSTLSYTQPFFLPENYNGRENETKFIAYLEKHYETIEWWFKNGTGREALGFKYVDSQTNKERIFYPDWILKFKDGRIGIYDTKGGITAKSQETKDKAECLAKRIKYLNDNSKLRYVGGIVENRNGVWYLNNSTNYDYGNNDDWKLFE